MHNKYLYFVVMFKRQYLKEIKDIELIKPLCATEMAPKVLCNEGLLILKLSKLKSNFELCTI